MSELLNLHNLESALKRITGSAVTHLHAERFTRGFSNLTFLLQWEEGSAVLRRPPTGHKAPKAHDMVREAKFIQSVKPFFKPAPEVLFYSDDLKITGAPFFIMKEMKGTIFGRNFSDDIRTPEQRNKLGNAFADTLASLHSIPADQNLLCSGHPEGYTDRQIKGWIRRYQNARTTDSPDFVEVSSWLSENKPGQEPEPSVIHNDFKFDNLVWNTKHTELTGVLDWEMATTGNPLMDLGNSLAYWIDRDDPEYLQQLRMLPTGEPGVPTRREIAELYCQKRGLRGEMNIHYYYVFGLFRLAGIMQQIYFRFARGENKDPRVEGFPERIKGIEKACLDSIEFRRI